MTLIILMLMAAPPPPPQVTPVYYTVRDNSGAKKCINICNKRCTVDEIDVKACLDRCTKRCFKEEDIPMWVAITIIGVAILLIVGGFIWLSKG